MKETNTFQISFKIACLILLLAICTFLKMIHSQLNLIPRFGDRYEEAGQARPKGAKDSIWNAPVIEVRGEEIEVTGGEMDVEVENRYPIEVKITN